MIRKILLFSAFIFSIHAVYAQGEMDAIKLSQNDLTGTARSVSMGGAFGALGGDLGGIAINPAGIGVYKSSEIVGTLNFQNVKTQTEMNAGKFDESKFKVNFDNFGFVTALPTNNDVAPYINFGISYNRLKNFDRKYRTGGNDLKWSMADYMAHRATGIENPDQNLWFQDKNDMFPLENYDWLAVFGYNSYLIGETSPGQYTSLDQIPANGTKNSLYNREKGSISTYDFNMGTTFSDIVSIGLTLSVTDVKYHLYSDYTEAYGNSSSTGFGMENYLKTEGSGFQVSPGVIVKPIDELRIGVAYHSPTWYNLSDYASAYFDYDLSGLIPGVQDNKGWIDTKTFRYDYRMHTPDKWTFSLAGVIGQTAIISADYEYTNYSNSMKVFDEHGDPMAYNPDPNLSIKKHYRGASTLRVGAEVRFTPQFSGRVGYAWMQSPFKTEFKEGKDKEMEAMTVGSITQYTLDGDKNYFTYGLGYRFSRNFYADIAFVMKNQKDDLQAFYTLNKEEGSQMKTNSFQGLLTLGYRF